MNIPQIVEHLPIERLIPYARNSRTHSDEQVAQIAASMREFGFTNPVLVDAHDGIIAGHGRVLAARKLDIAVIPCLRLGHLTETQKRAYIIADNRLAENAGWDMELLALEIEDLRLDGFDIELTGFDEGALSAMFDTEEAGGGIEPTASLSDRFLIPPFSVLNAREGWWQERKRAWLAIGIKSELGRGVDIIPNAMGMGSKKKFERARKASPGGGAMPAMDYSKKQRGDGRGRPIDG